MNQFRGLLLDRGNHLRMAMACGDDGDSGREIEEHVAVHVLDQGAAP